MPEVSEFLEELTAARKAAEEKLWEAQQVFWPDSRRVELSEVYRLWMPESCPDIDQVIDYWDKTIGKCYGKNEESQRLRDRAYYSQELQHRHRLSISKNLSTVLQFPAFVFYECGKSEKGTYRWRGCRYGLKGPEYMCGFGRV